MTAVVEGYDRDSEEYIRFLEDEFCRHKKAEERDSKQGIASQSSVDIQQIMDSHKQALDAIADRLQKLESGTKSSGDVSPASLMSSPLTKALAKLAGDEEDEGKYLCLEFYAQHDVKEKSRDHNKLDCVSLFYGWTCVAKYILKHGGNLESYINHLQYATGMLNTRQFYDAGAVKYDRLIVDKFLEGKTSTFEPDPVLSSLTFSSKIIPDNIEMFQGASLTKGVNSYQVNKPSRGKKRVNQPRRYDEVPPDFPSEICFYYNYLQCLDESCHKSHTCRKCGAKHQADSCRESGDLELLHRVRTVSVSGN